MGVIYEGYYIGSTGTSHTKSFPAAAAGHRIIVSVASYYMPTMSTSGYSQHAAADGYDHAHIYSKVAAGGESSVTVTVSSATDGVIMMVQVRDDCPGVLFATYGNGDSSATSVTCNPVTVQGGIGVVIAVLERPKVASLGSGGWTPAIPDWGEFGGGFGTTQNGAKFFVGPLPPPGQVTYTHSFYSAGYAHVAVVGFGTSDITAPTVPGNLRTTSVTGAAVSIAWDASTDNNGVSGYGVYLNGAKQGADKTVLAHTFSGLTTGQTYTIEVDARDTAGNRSAKTTITVLAVTDTTPPTSPEALRVVEVAHTTATLAWDAATDDVALSGYGVWLNGVKQGADQTALERTLTGLARGATYTVGVDAVDTVGHRSPAVEVQLTTLVDTLPSLPPGLTATAGQEDITLAWQPATDDLGIARYEVTLDGEVVAATATLGYVIEDLDPGTVYWVGVQAVDDGGGRGPEATVQVSTVAATWVPVASPVYRLGRWAANVRDEHGVEWVVSEEDGWSSSAEAIPLEADLDSGDGGFSGPGTFGQRLIVLRGVAIAPSRVAMLAAQERLAGVLHPREVATLRVIEAHLTRQVRVRLVDQVEITDRGSAVFEWTITVSAADPRRKAVRGIYREAELDWVFGEASAIITMAGDYPSIPARLQVWGPIKNFLITHSQSGLVIRSKPGTVLPADDRYSVEIDLATRLVLAHVPPEVWPEPRPGRGLLAALPARFALQPDINTLTLSGEPVPGETGMPRMVVEAVDAWM
ncbi:fibronectin type III domain-containing protein [Streptosporangium roseum]|uniref:fibronectin type III domain-containing protein n=1 Tax=Streptosporangium roseum TaxID=2001 RepID=UPI003332F8A8